jgi:hypothetical protein
MQLEERSNFFTTEIKQVSLMEEMQCSFYSWFVAKSYN